MSTEINYYSKQKKNTHTQITVLASKCYKPFLSWEMEQIINKQYSILPYDGICTLHGYFRLPFPKEFKHMNENA